MGLSSGHGVVHGRGDIVTPFDFMITTSYLVGLTFCCIVLGVILRDLITGKL